MSDPMTPALYALALPLISAILAGLMCLNAKLSRYACWPAILAFAGSATLAIMILANLGGQGGESIAVKNDPVTWFSAGQLNVSFTLMLDPLSAIMLATVTFVATFIAIFSAWYMRGDPGFSRYFAMMSLFVFAMCLLVLSNNFLLLLAGWEGVGVCSYLLVGYYYAKPAAAAAARKAFLVTRLGDVGFLIGIFMLWQAGGFHTDLDLLFQYIAEHPETHGSLNAACLFLFCGAVGKSAQLPLYVWLPDAMEGPTPVSALIHAATMVTAGVYLLARCSPLFVLAPQAQVVVSLIGGLTALLAAFIALAQTDLKRVLAYSTVSQLGYMFMALGTAGVISPSLAVLAAVFHLFTHAFFKALLFLGSGSVMHAMGNVIDMRRFGGLRTLLPITHWTFLAGCAALAGVPLLSGFWSKDQILDSLHESSHHGVNAEVYWFVLVLAMTTAGLTAFYTFRAYFLTFWGETKTPPGSHIHPAGQEHHHHHEGEQAPHHGHGHGPVEPWMMAVPLLVLAVGAIGIGFAVEPVSHAFSSFLAKTPSLQLANSISGMEPESAHPHFNWTIAGISSLIALAGIGLAAVLYRKGGPEVVPAPLRGVWKLSQHKLFVDEIYYATFVKPAELLATASRQFDLLLEALARLFSFVPRFVAAILRPLQNGLVQFYALGMILGLTAFLIVIVFRSN